MEIENQSIKRDDKFGFLKPYPANERRSCFLLPLDKRSSKSGLFFFTTLRQRIKLSFQNYATIAPRTRYKLCSTIQDLLGIENDIKNCTVFLGTSGPYRKQTIVQLNKNYKPTSVIKMASTDKAAQLIRREKSTLDALSSIPGLTVHTPRVLKYKSNGSFRILKQSVSLGAYIGKLDKLEDVFAFLKMLQDVTQSLKKLSESTIYLLLNQRYFVLRNNLSKKWKVRYECGLKLLDKIAHRKCMFVRAHRDFTQWNMRFDKNYGLFVYDWEYSEEGYSALYDLFHFFLMPLVLKKDVKWSDIKSIVKHVERNNFLGEGLGFRIELFLYLFDLCSFYLLSNEGNDKSDIVVTRYSNLIEILFCELGEYV